MHKEKKTDMNNEVWLEKIKARLSEHTEPLPDFGWERLERELSSQSKLIPFYRKVAVAAVVIGLLSFIGLRLINDKVSENDLVNDVLVSSVNADVPSLYVGPGNVVKKKSFVPSLLKKNLVGSIASIPNAESLLKKSELQDSIHFPIKQFIKEPEEQQTFVSKAIELPDIENPLLVVVDEPRIHRKGWTMSFSVGNMGGKLTNSQVSNDFQNVLSLGTGYVNMDLSTASNSVMTIPKDQDLVFQNGLPYLQRRTRRIISIDHKQPVSVGFSLRKNLAKGFSLETGLIYSYLASEVWYEGEAEKINQKLHYLGIPLRANWSFLERKYIVLYAAAGGTVEKCIYGKVGTKTTIVDPLQLSVMAGVGVQYNLSHHVGIYIEPGWAYYFDDGSDVQTIRKEQPSHFTLQAGFRLSY